MNSCKKCYKNQWRFYRKKGERVTMKCKVCGAKVTFNSKMVAQRKEDSFNAQAEEDKRGKMLAEWKKSLKAI